MKSFLEHCLEEAAHPGARTGLTHLGDLSAEDLKKVTKGGRVDLSHATTKTDGSAVEISWHPDHGLSTRHSGIKSQHGVTDSRQYFEHTKARADANQRPVDYTGARAFAAFHDSLSKNPDFIRHCQEHYSKHGSCVMKGELFSPHMARPSESHPGEVEQVSTPVHPRHMGEHGLFVIHSRLPQNAHHNSGSISRFSDKNLKFDTDVPAIPQEHAHVDVSQEHKELQSVDHNLASQKITPSNKEAVRAERAKIKDIGSRIYSKVRKHAQKNKLFKNQWGSGDGEGLVIHHPGARFKVTSPRFAAEVEKKKAAGKEATASKLFGKGNSNPTPIKVEEMRIFEGGNIKVKGSDATAQPISTKNREGRIRDFHQMLGAVHDEMHRHTGEHLFGKDKISLRTNRAFSGSTEHFMKDAKPLPKETMGDFDTLVAKEHVAHLGTHVLHPGKKYGKFTVVGTKKHGTQISAVMRHDDGSHHQVDFAGVPANQHHHGVPTEGARFLHSSSMEDAKHGIKGSHHKILLSAVAHHSGKKFNSVYGLHDHDENDSKEEVERKRASAKTQPEAVSSSLFGKKADHKKIRSFVGTSELIRDHVPKETHQAIYDKFKEGVSSKSKGGELAPEHKKALEHLRTTLGVSDSEHIHEGRTRTESHAYVSPLMGASPHTHMGHIQDVEGTMQALRKKHGEGKAFVGLSGKSQAFSDSEREEIARKQSSGGVEYKVHPTAGRAITSAVNSLGKGTKHLHIVVGSDRKDFAEKLRSSLIAGKIKDENGNPVPAPDHIHIHTPEDGNRSHGMSGTKMRTAASQENLDEYHRHLGSNFSRSQAHSIMQRTRKALSAGTIKINRQ